MPVLPIEGGEPKVDWSDAFVFVETHDFLLSDAKPRIIIAKNTVCGSNHDQDILQPKGFNPVFGVST